MFKINLNNVFGGGDGPSSPKNGSKSPRATGGSSSDTIVKSTGDAVKATFQPLPVSASPTILNVPGSAMSPLSRSSETHVKPLPSPRKQNGEQIDIVVHLTPKTPRKDENNNSSGIGKQPLVLPLSPRLGDNQQALLTILSVGEMLKCEARQLRGLVYEWIDATPTLLYPTFFAEYMFQHVEKARAHLEKMELHRLQEEYRQRTDELAGWIKKRPKKVDESEIAERLTKRDELLYQIIAIRGVAEESLKKSFWKCTFEGGISGPWHLGAGFIPMLRSLYIDKKATPEEQTTNSADIVLQEEENREDTEAIVKNLFLLKEISNFRLLELGASTKPRCGNGRSPQASVSHLWIQELLPSLAEPFESLEKWSDEQAKILLMHHLAKVYDSAIQLEQTFRLIIEKNAPPASHDSTLLASPRSYFEGSSDPTIRLIEIHHLIREEKSKFLPIVTELGEESANLQVMRLYSLTPMLQLLLPSLEKIATLVHTHFPSPARLEQIGPVLTKARMYSPLICEVIAKTTP